MQHKNSLAKPASRLFPDSQAIPLDTVEVLVMATVLQTNKNAIPPMKEMTVLQSYFRATLVAISVTTCLPFGMAQQNAPAGADSPVTLGAVRPGNLVLPQISIQIGGEANAGQIIQADLQLADIAAPPSNAAAASQAAEADRQLGQGVDFDAWTAAGVRYVLRGVVNGPNGQAELFDAASRQRLFGKTYQNAGEGRRLAHKISDDVMQAVTGGPGIFSSRIALLTGQATGKREVAVMDADGANLTVLTSENAIVATPAWGRGGNEIFFTSYSDNNPDLYAITLNRQRFPVSRRPGLNTSPNWSEAAGRLALTLSKDGNTEIYTMAADGGNLARLTNNQSADTAPAWSPDGTQIAFTSDESGLPQIYVMSANGSNRRRVSPGGYSDSPSWSPDGQKLAYVKRESGGFNIYVLDLKSGQNSQITNGGDNWEPSWAPNSRHLVFAGTRGGQRNIYLVNTETKQAKQLTKQGTFSSPVWGPLLP